MALSPAPVPASRVTAFIPRINWSVSHPITVGRRGACVGCGAPVRLVRLPNGLRDYRHLLPAKGN